MPQMPAPAAPPSGTPHDPYEFIMSPNQPGKQRLLPGGPMKLLIILGGAVILLFIIIIGASLFSGSNPAAKSFLTVAQQQQEIARVAGLQAGALRAPGAKNLATTAQLSMQSDSAALAEYMQQNGMKASSKQLSAGINSATDTKLQNAQNTNSLDATFVSELQAELMAYHSSLKKTYAQTTGKNGRALLITLDEHATLLLEQSKQ